MEKTMNEIISRLLGSERILLLCHVSPDGDCIGSLLALGRALKRLEKDVCMASEDGIPASLEFLVNSGEIVSTKKVSGDFDVAVAIDSGDEGRLGSTGHELYKKADLRINIDHHSSNPHYGDLNLVEPERAATGEIIVDLILDLKLELDSSLAEPLYTAIFTDTGGFRFSNTTEDTLNKAALLVGSGANPSLVSRRIYENKPLGYFKMLALAFERFTIVDKICYTWVSFNEIGELGLDFDAAEELSTYTKMVENMEVALVFKEKEENLVKVSLRSTGSFDVAKLAEKFGGGGHTQAAGCTILAPLKDAIKKVLQAAKGVDQ